MYPQSEVILRQASLFSGRVLLINPPQDQLADALASVECHVWTWNYADNQYFKQLNSIKQCHFSIEFPHQTHYEHIIIFNPKAKVQLNYVLHQIAVHCALNTSVILVGEKKAGIEGSAKLLHDLGKTHKVDSARHCQLWQMYVQKNESQRPLTDWIKSYDLSCAGQSLTIEALVGVFSQAQLDVGTAELLPYLTQAKTGKIADFGCGAGVIASYLACLNPQNQIIAYDVDAFALASTQRTAEKNQLTQRITIQPVIGVDDIEQTFDVIVSNPPFHQGVKTDYEVSERLCHVAKHHLTPTGELWIVANHFLNYPHLLKQHFSQVEIKSQKNGFNVIYAKK